MFRFLNQAAVSLTVKKACAMPVTNKGYIIPVITVNITRNIKQF